MFKNRVMTGAGICLFFTSINLAGATDFVAAGKVQNVRSVSLASAGADKDWISIAGFNSAGSCALSGGMLLMRLRDDIRGGRQIAIAMAAKLAGVTVQVGVNDLDGNKDSLGYCYVSWIDLQPN